MMFRAVAAVLCFMGFPAQAAQGGLRDLSFAPETATAMAGLEGEACGKQEYGRFKTIVCKIEKACKCADTVCELDWCSDYVHDWRKKIWSMSVERMRDRRAQGGEERRRM